MRVELHYMHGHFQIESKDEQPGFLSRITPLEVLEAEALDLNDPALKAMQMDELEKAWESDWAILYQKSIPKNLCHVSARSGKIDPMPDRISLFT